MARQFWKNGDPLNDRILIGGGGQTMKEFKDEPVRQIIGIVGDLRDSGLNRDPGPRMYVPLEQVPDSLNALDLTIYPSAWIVRTQANPATLVPTIQEQLRQATGLPVSDVHSMDEVVSLSTARQRFNMLLMTLFGCSALVLAAIGIYGLMAYSVQQRAQEIGIGARGGREAREEHGYPARAGIGIRGRLDRYRCGLWIDSLPREPSVRGQSSRPGGVRKRSGAVDRCSAICRLAARRARQQGESGGLSAI